MKLNKLLATTTFFLVVSLATATAPAPAEMNTEAECLIQYGCIMVKKVEAIVPIKQVYNDGDYASHPLNRLSWKTLFMYTNQIALFESSDQ